MLQKAGEQRCSFLLFFLWVFGVEGTFCKWLSSDLP